MATHGTRPDLHALLAEEERLAAADPRVRLLRVLGFSVPLGVTALLLLGTWLLVGPGRVGELLGAAVLIFTVLGKFAVLGGLAEQSPFGVWEWAALVVYMDCLVAALVAVNLPVLYRIPRMGPVLHELADHGHYMLETKPWLGRLTFLGVVLFVMFPLTGTGAVGGSIFGRLLGLGTGRTMAAIALGAVLGAASMALFGQAIQSVLTPEVRGSTEFQVVGVAVLGAVLALLWWRGRKVSALLRERRRVREEARG